MCLKITAILIGRNCLYLLSLGTYIEEVIDYTFAPCPIEISTNHIRRDNYVMAFGLVWQRDDAVYILLYKIKMFARCQKKCLRNCLRIPRVYIFIYIISFGCFSLHLLITLSASLPRTKVVVMMRCWLVIIIQLAPNPRPPHPTRLWG